MSFMIGDRVRIGENSEYYGYSRSNPMNVNGVIDGIGEGSLPIHVSWDNNETNDYGEHDLILVGTMTPRKYIKEFVL